MLVIRQTHAAQNARDEIGVTLMPDLDAQNDGRETYFAQRAETQLRLAQRASDPRVCKSHFQLANLLLGKAGHSKGFDGS